MTTATATKTRYKELKLATITPDPEQPRKTFDDEGIAELARSMAAEGLLQPITVKLAPTYSDRSPAYILIAGERRYRAATQLGWAAIPAILKDGIGEAEAAKLQLLENIVRKDLNPVEEAQAFQKMLDEGMTKQDLAAVVGKPTQFVTMAVEMLTVRPDVLHLVKSGQMPALTAFQMSKLDYNRQGQVLRVMTTQNISFNDVARLCQRLRGDMDQTEMFPGLPEQTDEARRIAKTFGAAFAQVAQVLNRIEALEEKRPGATADAIGPVELSQIDEAIKGLNRVKRLARDAEVTRLLEA